jgi:hypothetical protein
LKACNYLILSHDKIKDSIWEKIDETQVKIDTNELEDLFARAMPKPKEEKLVQSSINLNSEPLKKELVKLLGPDRSRNFEIILTTLKHQEGLITEALIQCAGRYATPKSLDSINKLVPTE